MTKEEKQLLLVDLCARLPYRVIVDVSRIEEWKELTLTPFILANYYDCIEKVRPYLRPMSSMTEEERKQYHEMLTKYDVSCFVSRLGGKVFDWLNAHHFDYRGLIEKGLALEATEDMYDRQI